MYHWLQLFSSDDFCTLWIMTSSGSWSHTEWYPHAPHRVCSRPDSPPWLLIGNHMNQLLPVWENPSSFSLSLSLQQNFHILASALFIGPRRSDTDTVRFRGIVKQQQEVSYLVCACLSTPSTDPRQVPSIPGAVCVITRSNVEHVDVMHVFFSHYNL